MKLHETPLPAGYSKSAIFLRTWLLNLQFRIESLPVDRKKMFAAAVYGICRGKKGIISGSRSSTTRQLAKSVIR